MFIRIYYKFQRFHLVEYKQTMLKVHNRWTSTTLLNDFFSFFVCNIEKRIVWCIFAKENYYILPKIAVNFRQVSLKGVLLSVSALKCFDKIFYKCLWKNWIFKKRLLLMNFLISGFQLDFFPPIYLSTYLQKPACVLYSPYHLYLYSYL